jgi:hypothetical protein
MAYGLALIKPPLISEIKQATIDSVENFLATTLEQEIEIFKKLKSKSDVINMTSKNCTYVLPLEK